MALSWSHTPEAYEAARQNLAALEHDQLVVIWAEWKCHARNSIFDQPFYNSTCTECALPDDVLVSAIWELAEAQATCSAGGHRFWMCPYGCGAHMVSCEVAA